MLKSLISLFCRCAMTAQLIILAVVILGVSVGAFVLYAGISHVKTANALDNAKTALIKDIDALVIRVDSKLVIGWTQVAEDYCTERELGQIDGKLAENRNAVEYLRIDDRTMANHISMTVYTSVTAKLRNAGQCALDDAVHAEMGKDIRIHKLWNIETASNVLHGMFRRISAAKDLHGLEDVQSELQCIKEAWGADLFKTGKAT